MPGRFNLVLTGVGGQGIITLGRLIGLAAIARGVDISIAEVHGMSQRGGSVVVHVRIGEGESPIIPMGGAHHIIALELLEAARSSAYANEDTVISVNDLLWPPPMSKYPPRDAIIKSLSLAYSKVYVFDGESLSKKRLGSPISSNIAMLGFALGVDERLRELITLEAVEEAIAKTFREPYVRANIEILREAYEHGARQARREGD